MALAAFLAQPHPEAAVPHQRQLCISREIPSPPRPDIRAACVRVTDVGGEEFQEARLRTITGGGNQGRTSGLRRQDGGLGDGGILASFLYVIKDIITYRKDTKGG